MKDELLLLKNRPFTVETPDGEWLFSAPQHIIAQLFHMSDSELKHMVKVCVEEQQVYILSIEFIPLPGLSVHIWFVEPWRRLMTEEQAKNAVEGEKECVRDDTESFAELWLDQMCTREVRDYIKQMEDDTYDP